MPAVSAKANRLAKIVRLFMISPPIEFLVPFSGTHKKLAPLS